MFSPDEMDALHSRVHQQRLLEEYLTALEAIWPTNYRWDWSPDSASRRRMGDDWLMNFRDDCKGAIAHVEPAKLPMFIEMACNVVWVVVEIINLEAA